MYSEYMNRNSVYIVLYINEAFMSSASVWIVLVYMNSPSVYDE